MKSAYLIYHNNQDPQISHDTPFGITDSEEHAKLICAEIIEYGNSLASQMTHWLEENISSEEFSLRKKHNLKILSKATWPHKWVWNGFFDFEKAENDSSKMRFKSETVAYKELPML